MSTKVLLVVLLSCVVLTMSTSTKPRQKTQKRIRPSVKSVQTGTLKVETKRKERAKSTVVSCRVFKRGTCRQTKENTISSNTSVKNKIRCQQLCFATQGCTGFTFHFGGSQGRRRCVMFRECSGQRGRCENCISGPIMPRVS